MWRASIVSYEKLTSRTNRNQKMYCALLFNTRNGHGKYRTSKKKHKTASSALGYAHRFNQRCYREQTRDYALGMRAGNVKPSLNLSTLYHLLFRKGGKLPLSIASFMEVLLVDISRWQGLVNFDKMKASPKNVRGVIAKASQAAFADIQFQNNWINSRGKFPRGAYHYYDSREEPRKQAQFFWSLVKNDPMELMPVVDYEENYGGIFKGHKNLRIFLEELMRLSGLPKDRIIIYTGYYYWLANSPTNSTELSWFKDFRLWEAWYTTNPANVRIPAPWTELLLWQWGTPTWGIELGAQSEEIDANWFYGTEAQYNQIFGLGGTPPPPPPGGTMNKFEVIGQYGLNLRPAPATNNTPKLLCATGTQLWGERRSDGWIHGTHYQQPNESFATLMDFYCAGGAGYVKDVAYTDPVVQPPPHPNAGDVAIDMTLHEDGTITGAWTDV